MGNATPRRSRAYPPHVQLPPPDRDRSPLTGWSRAHWETLADQLLESAARYATPDFAQFRLPGRNSGSGVVSDGIEGFARTFLLAAFRIAGARHSGDDATVARLVGRYATGIAAATDNSKKRYAGTQPWPAITDHSQAMVEAAAVAIALHETRDVLWDKLDDAARDNVRAWLGTFVGKRTHANNWILFQVITEQFLKSVDGPHDDAEIARGLDRIEDWYVGDGWYTDGGGQNFDYYIGWAMHLYPLLWLRMTGPGGDGGRGDTYRARLSQYLGQYQYFFGREGAPVHQGRSLTYRYACAAPLWLGEVAGGRQAGATPLAPGQARRLASGAIRHFTERGVPNAQGLLCLGWYEPFLPATQHYSGPGSPYWASKGFLGLLLPPDHPAWTDTEQPAANDYRDQVRAMPAPGFLLHSTRGDGIVRLLNHGSDHQAIPPAPARDDPHYAKFGYSNRTGPGASDASWRADTDNHLAVLAPDGSPTRRARIERIAVADGNAGGDSVVGDRARSRYRAVLPGPTGAAVTVETDVLVRGAWEIRAHLVSAPAGTAVRDGGYAIAGETRPTVRISGQPVRGSDQPGQGPGRPGESFGDHGDASGSSLWALAEGSDGLASLVIGLHGWAEAKAAQEAEATAFGPLSATPYLLSALRDSAETVHVTLVALTGDAIHPEALAAAVTAEVTGRAVRVHLPGETVELALGSGSQQAASPEPVPPAGQA
ncbi:MAG TPA: DUF2264 domain-containing protein [Trebonia sp.]|jgi:hypothetical protein